MFGRKLIKLSHVISVRFVQPKNEKKEREEQNDGVFRGESSRN